MDALSSPTQVSMVDGEYWFVKVGYGSQRVRTFDAATAADDEKESNSLASATIEGRREVMRSVGSNAR